MFLEPKNQQKLGMMNLPVDSAGGTQKVFMLEFFVHFLKPKTLNNLNHLHQLLDVLSNYRDSMT